MHKLELWYKNKVKPFGNIEYIYIFLCRNSVDCSNQIDLNYSDDIVQVTKLYKMCWEVK